MEPSPVHSILPKDEILINFPFQFIKWIETFHKTTGKTSKSNIKSSKSHIKPCQKSLTYQTLFGKPQNSALSSRCWLYRFRERGCPSRPYGQSDETAPWYPGQVAASQEKIFHRFQPLRHQVLEYASFRLCATLKREIRIIRIAT